MGTKFAFPRKSHPAHWLYILKRKMRANSEPNEPSERNGQKWAKFESNEPNLPNSRWSSEGLILINQIFRKKISDFHFVSKMLFNLAQWSFSYWLKKVLHIGSIVLFILAQKSSSYWLNNIVQLALWSYLYWLIAVVHIGWINSKYAIKRFLMLFIWLNKDVHIGS